MMMPAIGAPVAPLSSAASAVLEFPVDGMLGALAALSVLTLLAIGATLGAYVRTKRATQPVSIASSAAA